MKKAISMSKVVGKPTKKYIIRDNPNASEVKKNCSASDFIFMYVPSFGKYEIEKFVGEELIKALFQTKDITDLFENDICCDDFPFETIKVLGKDIKEKVLKCFEKVGEDEGNIYVMFKWVPYENIEKGE